MSFAQPVQAQASKLLAAVSTDPLDMKTLLLTIGFSLIAILQAQDPPALGKDTVAVSGKWYLKAMTADQEVPEKPDSVTPMILKAQKGGNLEAKITMLTNGQCQNITVVLHKTSEPGKYTAYEGQRVVFIQPSPVRDHYILYCEGELHGRQIRMAKLLGRDPEQSQEALEDFREFSRAKGLNQEILELAQSGRKDACAWSCPIASMVEPPAE
uniref:Lipocalin/cytosolic fatty-acid binding domain-containing protein n=2 Tax=Canis lupus TaxID=9612 RepID=A0A8C0PRL5_CANLF